MASIYQDPVSNIFDALGEGFKFLEIIGPAIKQWIENKFPLQQQRIMDRRIRRCKRICRKEHLTKELITDQVNLDFKDLTDTQKDELTALLVAELQVKN